MKKKNTNRIKSPIIPLLRQRYLYFGGFFPTSFRMNYVCTFLTQVGSRGTSCSMTFFLNSTAFLERFPYSTKTLRHIVRSNGGTTATYRHTTNYPTLSSLLCDLLKRWRITNYNCYFFSFFFPRWSLPVSPGPVSDLGSSGPPGSPLLRNEGYRFKPPHPASTVNFLSDRCLLVKMLFVNPSK